jgi:hypothetical protein
MGKQESTAAIKIPDVDFGENISQGCDGISDKASSFIVSASSNKIWDRISFFRAGFFTHKFYLFLLK